MVLNRLFRRNKSIYIFVGLIGFCFSYGCLVNPAEADSGNSPDPFDLIGSRLHLHPGVAVAGVFSEPVNSWQGIPQSYECTEFLSFEPASERRVWIIPSSAHPVGVASFLPAFGLPITRMI